MRVEDRRGQLVARHHLSRSAGTVVEAVADLVALHSSDPLTPHLALWARCAGYRTTDLDAALVERRSLWRLHAMRRTLWVAPTTDVGMLHEAVGSTIAEKERARLLGWIRPARPDAEAWLDSLQAQVVDAVRATPGIGTRALTARLPELATKVTLGSGRWQTEAAVASRVLYQLAMELRLVRTVPAGSWKSSQYGWAVPDAVTSLDTDAARAALVRRYVERFGPVTRTDVKWWTGLTVAQTKRALKAADVVQTSLGGVDAWHVPSAPADPPSGVALLPGLDPTPMGYKDRAWFLGDHQAALFDRNGNVGPTVWVDGRIVGGWAVRTDGVVATRLLEDVGATFRRAVDQEADALATWLDGTAVTPRFRTPLERELAG